MTDFISTLYLNSQMLNRLCGEKRTYRAKNALISEHKNNATVYWAIVSDILTLFPHLTLDERYELICYAYHHYHGVNGKVVAVPKTVSFVPDVKSPGGFNGFWGPTYSIPKDAVPPMEAIYTDGTAEGYFEAIMAKSTIPNMILNGLECTRSHGFITELPETFPQDWEVSMDLSHWRPHIIHNHTKDIWSLSIICKTTEILDEDTLKPFTLDRLFLRNYTFQKTMNIVSVLTEKKYLKPISENHLFDNSRYTEHRRCAIPKEQSIFFASRKSSYQP